MSAYVNAFVLVAIVPVCIFFVLFRGYYIKTARQLKRLEAESKILNINSI